MGPPPAPGRLRAGRPRTRPSARARARSSCRSTGCASADGRDVWIRDEMTVVRGPADRSRTRSSTASSSTSPTASGWRPSSSGSRSTTRSPDCPTARCSPTACATCSAAAAATSRHRRLLPRPRPLQAHQRLARPRAPATRCCARWRAGCAAVLRPEDTVARFGGDEFTILCETRRRRARGGRRSPTGCSGPLRQTAARRRRRAAAAAQHRRGAGARPGEQRRRRAPDRGRRRRDVPRQGARRRAHRAVRQRDARARGARRCAIEQELQRALEQGELRLYYQPGVDLATGQVVGAEALVRWEHPRARAARAGPVPERGRGDRPDRAARGVGRARGLPAPGRVAARPETARPAPVREPGRARADAPGRRRRRCWARARARGSTRTRSDDRGDREHGDGRPRHRASARCAT